MKLVLQEATETVRDGARAPGTYRVDGLPPNEHAVIAYVQHAWRFLRWNDTEHGNWTGKYESPDAALAALCEELVTNGV